MITVTETSTRTLATSDDVAAFLEQRYAQMEQNSPFRTGEAVAIASRAGLPADLGAGDVALMLLDLPGAPFSHVLVLAPSGVPIVVQLPTENLAKRTVQS